MTNRYESPLASRYASEYMLKLFSSDTRYQTWRRLWVSLAKAEMALGLPVTKEHQAKAYMSGRDYVKPDDVKSVAKQVLLHRIALNAEAKVRKESPENILKSLILEVKVPIE